MIAYDDSDGGYDHVNGPHVNDSQTPFDALTGPGECGGSTPQLAGYQARCGYGPRLPLLVVSPYSKVNAVDHGITDQTSIIRFVEDNWLHGQRIGDGSYDELSGRLTGMFDFSRGRRAPSVFLKRGAWPRRTAFRRGDQSACIRSCCRAAGRRSSPSKWPTARLRRARSRRRWTRRTAGRSHRQRGRSLRLAPPWCP